MLAKPRPRQPIQAPAWSLVSPSENYSIRLRLNMHESEKTQVTGAYIELFPLSRMGTAQW